MDNGIRAMVLGLPRAVKRAIVMAVDAGLAVLSVWIAFYLRLGYFLPVFGGADGLSLLPATIVTVVVSTPIFIVFGLYRTIFRYSGAPAVLAVTKAIAVYGVIFASLFTLVGVNGVPDAVEDTPDSGTTDAPLNADGDALPNYLDIDADGDGIIDNIEGQTTDGYVAPNDTFTDIDGNGVDDIYDINGTPIQPANTDTFDQPDYLDINSDNDGDSDLIEAYDTNGDGVADITPTGTDSDNDGLDDAFDDVDLTVDDFQDNPDNNDQLPTDFPDDELANVVIDGIDSSGNWGAKLAISEPT